MRLYTGFTRYIWWYLETILVASRNNRFDVQISQTDKVCCLSAENGERASLKSMTKNQHPKILNRKKKDQLKKKTATKKKTKKNCQPQGIKDVTPACVSR